MADFGISAVKPTFTRIEFMNAKHLRISTVVISYLVFFAGWALRVVCVDLSGLNEFLSWTIGFLIHFVFLS